MTRGMDRRATSRTVVVLAALTALVGALLIGVPQGADARATGMALGTIRFPHQDNPKVKVLWFTKDWGYLGTAAADGGTYYLPGLEPGTYRLQFVDQRPSYDVDKYAPTDTKVTVRDGHTTRKNVTMTEGAFITGTIKAHGRVARHAKVVAANTEEQSFTTTADKRGRFAVGGLPASGYSLFGYDPTYTWAGRSTWAGNLTPGASSNIAINLTKRAGSLRVALFTRADGRRRAVSAHPVVTAVSKKTGQFWSIKVKHGSANFRGLFPGKYKLVANGFGVWFGKTAAVRGASVRANRGAIGTFTYTKRGGWVTGTIVDGSATTYPLRPDDGAPGAAITLVDDTGVVLAGTTSDDSGHFKLSGRLTTRSGLTILVDPDTSSGGYMTGAERCEFDDASRSGIAITIGRETDAGSVVVPRAPVPDTWQNCH